MANQYIIITRPIEVEIKIIQRNIQHFGQAQEGTPINRPQITQALGYTGARKKTSRLMKGEDMDWFIEY